MFPPLAKVLYFHSAAHDKAVIVKQRTTILTFAAEIGEWSMLFQRQTSFTLFML